MNDEQPIGENQARVSTAEQVGQTAIVGHQLNSLTPTSVQAQTTSTQTPLSAPAKKVKRSHIIFGAALVLVLCLGGGAYALFSHHTSYQTIASSFVLDVQKKDKKAADALESSAYKAALDKEAGDSSFYDACRQAGSSCTPLFQTSFLNKATKTFKNYSAKSAIVSYTFKTTTSGAKAGGAGCTATTDETLLILVTSKSNSWLINSAEPAINNSSHCPQSQSSAAPSTTTPPTTPPPATSSSTTPTPKTTTIKNTSNTASSAPAPTPSPGSISITSDGCYVNAVAYSSGMSVVAGAIQGGHGGDNTYPLTVNNGVSEPTGGQLGYTAYGELLDSSGNVVANASAPVTSSSCPPISY